MRGSRVPFRYRPTEENCIWTWYTSIMPDIYPLVKKKMIKFIQSGKTRFHIYAR